MFGIDGPPTFKMKKMSTQEFESYFGRVQASARYSDLAITSTEVSIRWNPNTKEFKLSGSYGDPWRMKS
jgi:hypothetical protein